MLLSMLSRDLCETLADKPPVAPAGVMDLLVMA